MMRRGPVRWIAVLAVACLGASLSLLATQHSALAAGSVPAISVVGNQLETNGQPVQLRGVNRDAFGGCTTPAGTNAFPDGPTDLTSIQTMLSWGINTIRLPLNEGCWLGEPSADAAAQSAYQSDVENYVNLLTAQGQYVILALQFTAPPGYVSNTQDYYADATETPAFWTAVANTFKGDPNVLFDPFSEPAASQYNGPDNSDGSNWSFDQIWNCWLNDCSDVPSVYGPTHSTVGENTLISTIRNTGATNPVIINSPDFSFGYDETCGSQSCFAKYTPSGSGLVIDAHIYDFDVDGAMPLDGNGNADPTPAQEQQRLNDAMAIFTSSIAPLDKTYPVMLGELGESDCDNADGSALFEQGFLNALDSSGANIGVTPWTWNSDSSQGAAIATGWQCPTKQYGADGSLLIRDYNGTPTSMGQAYKSWVLAKTTPSYTPTPPVTSTPSSPPATSTPPAATPPAAPSTTTTAGTPAPTPRVHTAPHVAVSATELTCSGASFTNAPKAKISYSFSDTTSRRRLGSSVHLALSHAYARVISCTATTKVGSTTLTTTSRSLPVPGKVSAASSGTAALTAVCPKAGGHSCRVSLVLRHGSHSLGSAAVALRAGRTARITVRLSSAGKRLVARSHTLSTTLTATETINRITQTVASHTFTVR